MNRSLKYLKLNKTAYHTKCYGVNSISNLQTEKKKSGESWVRDHLFFLSNS